MKTLTKICGITDERGLNAAIEFGAAYIGLNFFRRSPRFVTLEQAAELASKVKRGVKIVGLFVDPTDADLQSILAHVRLDMIQLHGKETPARVDQVRALTGLQVMKAVGVETERDVMAAQAYENHADWLLFDAKAPKDATRPGGNAVAFNWAIMKAHTGKTPWMLAGGLTRANVGAAIKASGARVVDVSSGVESKPGTKSPARIRAFLKAVEAASAGRAKA
jgi:phosphoribosylanthranilate isomerase